VLGEIFGDEIAGTVNLRYAYGFAFTAQVIDRKAKSMPGLLKEAVIVEGSEEAIRNSASSMERSKKL